MEVQRYEELDKLCKEMEKLMTREIQETLERHCEVKVYYFFTHDIFSCEVDVPYYNATLGAGCTIPAKDLRSRCSKEELREICIDYAGTIATCIKDSMSRFNEEGGN